MHALQKGLVEKEYCIALVQCICVVRLCLKFGCTALAQCISVIRTCFNISRAALAQCIFVVLLCFQFSCTALAQCFFVVMLCFKALLLLLLLLLVLYLIHSNLLAQDGKGNYIDLPKDSGCSTRTMETWVPNAFWGMERYSGRTWWNDYDSDSSAEFILCERSSERGLSKDHIGDKPDAPALKIKHLESYILPLVSRITAPLLY